MSALARLRRDRCGVSTIEYAVLAFALVAVVGVVMAAFGGAMNGFFSNTRIDIDRAVATAVSGTTQR